MSLFKRGMSGENWQNESGATSFQLQDATLFFLMQNNHTMTQHSTIIFFSIAFMHPLKLQNDKS